MGREAAAKIDALFGTVTVAIYRKGRPRQLTVKSPFRRCPEVFLSPGFAFHVIRSTGDPRSSIYMSCELGLPTNR